ncbi:acetoacetate--CoA ligase [Marinobacterium jannaschii]|uniref:acetoacetate--CoA ligase n=1 Tax=Marinobacterium jannaschii TaxID=64970 RepID=UPI000488F578|nr:acetoacetate--CoA ligase [Marinobacterium jannaschii]
MKQPLWIPDSQQRRQSNLQAFMAAASSCHSLELDSYETLYAWSVAHTEAFWDQLWQFSGLVASSKGTTVLQHPQRMPGAQWYPDARLNFAENLLRFRDHRAALIFRNEDGARSCISYANLYQQVARLAAAFRCNGIRPGDRIAGFMPNIPATVTAMLAATSVGAIWTSCSPDFGIHGVIDRFGQTEPRILITADGYHYNGSAIDSLTRVKEISWQLESLETIVVVPYLNDQPDISALPDAILLQEYEDKSAKEIIFEQLPFDHPLYILYSSGTTGVPKCILHSAGGTLLQHLKEHLLHTDLKREDVLFYYTTCGWMMWNWLVSGLATGATLLLFDGSPFAPAPEILWDIADEEDISVFGTSAKYLAALEKSGVRPARSHRLSALRALLSTGSPLAHEGFHYCYREIKQNMQLASISGGTDIISCFALGCPIRPVYAGQLQCRGLGMAVDIFDPQGRSIRGEKGELVCTRPFPSMPIGFWNDPEDKKYQTAYFSQFKGVWAHGDYGEITAEDGLIIHGRSDAVLNPGGVRIGTAEIYRQVDKVDAVLESICIAQPWQDDVRIVLFVRLKSDLSLSEALITEIRQTIRQHTTARHVPAKVIQVSDIPRTRSGKIVELAVRKVVLGEPVTNKDALANPESLEQFRDLEELKT